MVNADNDDCRRIIGVFEFSAKLHAMRSIDLFINSLASWLLLNKSTSANQLTSKS